MKTLPFCFLFTLVSCSKNETPAPKRDITFSIVNNSDVPFWGIEIGEGSDSLNASKNNWVIYGKGTFDTTISKEIGAKVYLRVWTADSKWAIKITQNNNSKETGYKTVRSGQPYDPAKGYVFDGPNATIMYFGVVRDTIK
ncbi:hypothetical protein ACE38W_14590 [Chitinophaga sp. Hz27]|uniref:hypothetical protein n=1 Tax=Chitinophaga sp. Hz27 TaxID=3347169 RepID=UPI0035D67E54